ncbi:hypothetical protein PFISCL1PPCAC_12281, partial [Pristionchus fissidentatus]
TIKMSIDDVTKVCPTVGETSPVTRINGFPWRLRFTRSEDGLFGEVALICDKSTESDLWMSKTFFNTQITCGGATVHNQSLEHSFNSWNSDELFLDYFEFDASKKVVVEVRMTTVGDGDWFTRKQPMEWFLPTDVALVIGWEKIHVNKQALAAQSDYFNALFFGGFKEMTQSEIEIEDVDEQDFTLALKMLMIDEYVTDASAESILKIADQFGYKILLNKTNEFLLNSSSLSDHTKLRLSDHYKLHYLQEFLLPLYKSIEKVQELKRTEEFAAISNEMKPKIFDGI